MRARATAALVAGLVACLLAPEVAAAGSPDQQQTAFDNSAVDLDLSKSGAQTFTAGVTGGLDRVDLLLAAVNTPTAYLTVEIRDAPGGVPGQAVFAARSIPPTDITNTTAQFITVPFRPPAPVVAGTQYAIVAYSGNIVNDRYNWFLKVSDVYPGGELLTGPTPPTSSWTPSGFDAAFRTYVVPAPATPTPTPTPTPTAGPTGQRAAALTKCKHKHGKKRKRCKRRANRLPV